VYRCTVSKQSWGRGVRPTSLAMGSMVKNIPCLSLAPWWGNPPACSMCGGAWKRRPMPFGRDWSLDHASVKPSMDSMRGECVRVHCAR